MFFFIVKAFTEKNTHIHIHTFYISHMHPFVDRILRLAGVHLHGFYLLGMQTVECENIKKHNSVLSNADTYIEYICTYAYIYIY